ncbi:MAG: metallopeptidase TldD-related protein [Candidatus Eisenbacteria bacterium]
MKEHATGFPVREDIERALAATLAKGAEFAEVYLQRRTTDTVQLEAQIVREASRGITAGAGIRAISGEKIGYAYTDDLDPARLIEAAGMAAEIATGSDRPLAVELGALSEARPRSAIGIFPVEIEAADKIETARSADQAARDYDKRISEVLVGLTDSDKRFLIANSEGTHVSDRQILTSLRITTVAEAKGLRQRGFRSLSGTVGYEIFDKESPKDCARDAARQAVGLLDAQEAPAGKMVLVLGSGRGGVLLHEAIGHGFEGDFIRKKTSLFTGMIGEKIAAETCTIVDDATIPGLRGTINVDDEGTPGGRTVLVERGILKGFLFDKLNGRLMNSASTGNGRRQSYKYMPVVRMTNTFMQPGETPPEEIIASVKQGFYAKRIGGGQVDIASGNFVFEVMEGYLIEDGRVGPPVRGANLIGNGAEVLKKIEMVGNDFAYDPGGGTCGKAGQAMPVGNGVPTVKLSEITVGGTRS